MSLASGTRLGPYEILALIGAGGMGEVYRARDTRLGRDVAIKVSTEQFTERFEREARAIAALNHPNICQLYDVGPNYLVMELVEGAPLKGPLPLEKAIEYAGQILDALDAAHKKGVTHRDLKPSNILVTKQGIKLLDFGLARIATGDHTLSMAGQVAGTPGYMSPEQWEAKPGDARSDIYSFGCVLYEMLTGKRAAEERRALEPAALESMLAACIEKDPDERWQSARDIKRALALPTAAASSSPSRWRVGLVVGVLAVALVVLGGLYWRTTRPVDHPLMRLNVDLGPDAVAGQFNTVAISPDGTRLVFPVKGPDGKPVLATRLLSETKPALLSGTENGIDPFFSPDGKWIGFFADRKMKKISVQGGAPVVLCDAPNARGANWGRDGNIIVTLNNVGALSRVPADGGPPQPVTKLPGALTHRWPQPLPGSEAVLFTLSPSSVSFEEASIAAVSMKTGEIKILVPGGYFGRYLPTGGTTGHLVYVHQGVLFGVPFDPARLELRGTAVPLLEDLAGDPNSGAGQFSFSRAGTLVYRTGKVAAPSWPVWWLDRSGKTQPLIATPGFYVSPRFSPDGQRLALTQTAGNNRGIFVYDLHLEHMSPLTADTYTQATSYPTWTPDGKHIVFRFSSAGGFGLGWIRADGSGEIHNLLDRMNNVTPNSFFPDGRRLAYTEFDPSNSYDLWTLPLDTSDPDHPKPGKPELFLRTPATERSPSVSPDSHWVAYHSNESGRNEVYVRPFPPGPGKWPISNPGGTIPIWSRNGRELFFQNPESRIMVTDYTTMGDSFMPGKPRLWSEQQLLDLGGILNYDLAPDGKRFAIFSELQAPVEEKGDVHVTFLLNFFDELRRRAPVGK